ncbi:hypothetical protein [Lactiplantibacillus pentosus]|uniref:hypothetical protein n=1 Tax=Lactiplantibacillus pentosus TaxID=1589 RepID=UPI0021822CB8|nr:hypothetical protein [Lactiplantibacillus pentosus]
MAAMINQELFSSNKEDWETSQDFYGRLNAKYHFEWDLAASDDNLLEQDWRGLSGNLFLIHHTAEN